MGIPKSIDYKKCIYGLTGPDGTIRYVGQARYAAERLALHKLRARKGTHPHLPVYIWMNEVGLDNVKVVILEKIQSSDKTVADELETKHIAEHRSLSTNGEPLTNLSDGGSSVHLPSMLRSEVHPRTGAKLTPRHKATLHKARDEARGALTPEQREESKKRASESAKRHWASISEDERAERIKKVREARWITRGMQVPETTPKKGAENPNKGRGPHVRFHINRGTANPKCRFCIEGQ